MNPSQPHEPFALFVPAERIEVVPVADLTAHLAALVPDALSWGFVGTAAEARLGLCPVATWRERAADPRLLEMRLWDEKADFHWRDGAGVLLRTVPEGGEPKGEFVGGAGWLARDRRSRLWGEWLAEADGWYEERVPDVHRYEGVPAGSLYAFLRAREYLHGGVVEAVRYLGVEGGKQ